MKRNKCSKDKRRAEVGRRFLTGVVLLGLAGATVIGCSGDTAEVGSQSAALFTEPPNTIGLTIEGCRNDGSPPITPGGSLPNDDGRFTCQDDAPLGGNDNPYTTGNLGKGWNELDLVPFRLILTNSGAATSYNVVIAADKLDAGVLGYDVITEPEVIPAGDLNGYSDPGCAVTSTAQADGPAITGGADVSIYRELTITHPAGATCVIDWAQRLSIEAADYPGSNLQAYKFESDDFQGGKATIPIPVREIQPQELRKDMTATQDTDFAWNVTKAATPATVDLGNTCDPNNANEAPVTFRVEWEILPGAPGMVMVVTNIYAKNPAARPITVNVEDTIFGDLGAGEVPLDTANSGDVIVPANTELKVFEHTYDADDSVSNLNDVATATYIDTATGIPVPGQTEATASAMIQPGTQTNTTAILTDTESISGNGLQYSLDSLTGVAGACSVDGAPYVPGLGPLLDQDDFPLICVSDPQNGIIDCTDPDGCLVGAADVTKTIYVDPVPAITTGTLSDTVVLDASDGFQASSGPVNITISTNAKVELTLVKTIPDILQGDETITCNFEVKDSSDNVVGTPSFVFSAGDTQKMTTLTGLMPDTYTVVEGECGGLVPDGGSTQMIDLNLPTCDGTVTFNNIVGEGAARAEVNKVTFPAGFENGWVMTLKGPGLPIEGLDLTISDSDPAAFEQFPFGLLEGDYMITETLQNGWENTASSGCEFTIDYPADFGAVKQCSFTNKKLGRVIINKVTDPMFAPGLFEFTDNIPGPLPNPILLGGGSTTTQGDVPSGTYTVTETDPTPEFDLVVLNCTDDADQNGYNVIDSSTDLVNGVATINLDPGETVECTYTNRQRGMVDLLKLTNGVEDPNMAWSFTLNGPEVNVGDSTPPTLVDFDMAKLIPGETYTLCETGIPPSWTIQWALDANDNGIIDDGETLPFVGASTGNPLEVYDPTFGEPGATNDTRCVDFTTMAAETLHFIIDNQRPGGEPRTPGYWKNWNTCTGGNQVLTAEGNGGVAEGWFLLDDLIPTMVGDLYIETCEDGVLILDHRDLNGKKRASDAAYNLARNLLAAKLNLAAGAETCQAVVDAVAAGDALLSGISFDGTGAYLRPRRNGQLYQEANALASMLDEYNNGELCQ
ncbi:MAG: hypothetical protein ACN4G0_15935 [Polyangiales bacterium]